MTDSRKKILLVENDGFTRFMMQEIRDTLGVSIDISASIHDGMIRFKSDPGSYGVVLMDVNEAEVDGLMASQSIRGLQDPACENIAIIAVSCDERLLDDGVLSSYGIDGHIQKPLTPGEVMALVDRYC
ncbi:MAG: response regulator [Rhodobacteraceae bacterium]|nr:response regulator [Paracoccaceae bacterium]